ncbi:hypothetical protein HYY75_12015 [bacterium]|nr:hypothetical protein [bacterium]
MEFSKNLHELLDQQIFFQKLIWFMLTGSIFVYIFIAFIITTQLKLEFADMPDSVFLIVKILSFGCGIAAIFLRKHILSDEYVKSRISKENSPEDLAKLVKSGKPILDLVGKIEKLTPPEREIYGACKWYFRAEIICLALGDNVVILGFLNSILVKNWQSILPYAGVTLALNFAMFPRFHHFIRAYLKAEI